MKNCENYQMMLSDLHDDNKDIPIDLEQHVQACVDCKEFQIALQKQSKQLQDLPKVKFQTKQNKSIISNFWTTKISVPLPAAAAVFLFLFGTFWLVDKNRQVEPQVIEVEQKQVDYQNVQFVKFSPQPAVLVESNENTGG